jgi:hypothetical protein
MVQRTSVFPDNWLYIHSPEVKLGRIQNYKNWSPDMVPDPASTSLGLEYFLWDQDEEWGWPQERLIERGIQECVQIGLIDPSEVTDGTVVRMPKAYPVYDQRYRNSIATLRAYMQHFKNLQTIGRNGLHRYNNQDHSMLTGVYAARNVLGDTYDVWSVNTEQVYHEERQISKATAGDRLVPTRLEPDTEVTLDLSDAVIDVAFANLDPVALGTAVSLVSGTGLFLVAAILLLNEGAFGEPNLALLGNYLYGFSTTWKGALLGFVEAGAVGFVLGSLGASLRNRCMRAYAALIRRRLLAQEQRDLLDKV